MRGRVLSGRARHWWTASLGVILALAGCESLMKSFSGHLTHWQMLDQAALDDPIKAVGGDGIVFVPRQDGAPLNRRQLAAASPEALVSYYAPIVVQ
jgi:hypothetical protein